MATNLIICGAGGHAKVVIETIQESDLYSIKGLIVENSEKIGSELCGIKIIDEEMNLHKYLHHSHAFVAIGNVKNYKPRHNVYSNLKLAGFPLANIFSSKSIISPSAIFGEGNFVAAGAIITSGVSISDNCILNTGCIIEHDCFIGTNVHVASGAILLGSVHVGDDSLIGAGSTIKQGVSIGSRCIIGAGSVVLSDVPSDSTVVGVPAKI